MSLTRSLLLAASQNRWLRDHATRYRFVRSSVSRFMPGETFDDAMQAYRRQDWPQAAAKFADLLTHYPEDGPSQVLLQRVLEFQERAPAAD